ncbi:MAG: hypothetical protein ACR2OH_01200 [Microthrixaceae bacterium]
MSDAIEYDCSPWAGETRRILRSVLTEAEVPHAWEGTVLVVPADFEDQVDAMVDDVEATARAALGSAREKVGYDVSPWSAASINQLVNRLVEETIPHEWDAEGDLLVHEEDAELIEGLIEELGEPDGADDIDGLELHDRLGKLFVAADRLSGNPHDSAGLRDIEGAYEQVESAPLPYGIGPQTWLGLHQAARRLIAAIDGEELDETDLSPKGATPGSIISVSVGAQGRGSNGDAGSGGPDPDADPDDAADLFEEPTDPVQESARALRDLLRSFV